MNLARLTWGVVLIVTVLTLMGTTVGLTIGSALAEDSDAPDAELRNLKIENATLRERLRVCRDFEGRFAAEHKTLRERTEKDITSARRTYDALAESWKRRVALAEDRIDVLEKGLVPTEDALRQSHEGRRKDVMQLQQQLQEANERGNRQAIEHVTSESKHLVYEERLESFRAWLVGLLARVGRPALPVLLQELEDDPQEAGRWVLAVLTHMGPEAREAASLLERIVADAEMQANGVARVAEKTLEAIRKK